MASSGEKKQMGEESDLTLEVVLLLILGVFMLLFGLLLFRIDTGDIPYTPDSTYGLFLIILSFQTITLGKTPFGDLRRSWILVIIGICTAVLGMAACFIPGYLAELIRILVGITLVGGGIALLLQLYLSKDKARTWMTVPGLLQQLTIACSLVYVLSVILGLVTLLPGITTNPQTAILLILYGAGFFSLAWCVQRVTRQYSSKAKDPASSNLTVGSTKPDERFWLFRDISLPLSQAVLVFLGVLLSFLGILLIPVNLGMLPFSPDGQLGLLLVILAIQILALGNTPLGQVKRSWEINIIGILFVTMGIFSCIVPGILTGIITMLIGILNITGGSVLLLKQYFPILHDGHAPLAEPRRVPPTLKNLFILQTMLSSVGIIFGVTMLLPNLVSGLVIGGILVLNGLLLFALMYLIRENDRPCSVNLSKQLTI